MTRWTACAFWLASGLILASSSTRASAACAPATGSNETVTCTGGTLNQGPGSNTGYGDSTQNGLTLTVNSGASVIGTSTGIDVNNNNTIINLGTITTNGSGGIGNVNAINSNGPLTLINSGSIGRVDLAEPGMSDSTGVNINGPGLNVTNNSGGLIQGDVAIQGNGSATVTNSGTISGIVGGGGQGINVNGGSVTVTNNSGGLITADGFAITADTVTVTNSGTISTPEGSGGTAISGNTSAMVTNNGGGLITGDAGGISAPTIAVTNLGTISGTGLGASGIFGGTVQVTNSGTITGGAGAAAISMESGSVTNNAGGTISSDEGISVGGNTSIFNAGTITGTTGTAIAFSSGGNTLTLGPGFTINGTVVGAGADTFQLGGSGNGSFNLSSLGVQYTPPRPRISFRLSPPITRVARV